MFFVCQKISARQEAERSYQGQKGKNGALVCREERYFKNFINVKIILNFWRPDSSQMFEFDLKYFRYNYEIICDFNLSF